MVVSKKNLNATKTEAALCGCIYETYYKYDISVSTYVCNWVN